MFRPSFNFEFFLLFFISILPWPQLNVAKVGLCSRDSSRLIRKLVQLKWQPILDRYHVELPKECPFHKSRDVFGLQQKAKKQNRPSQWTCRLCGKSFFEEKFIDLHFDSRHSSHINDGDDSVCLADFCDIMRCEVYWSQDLAYSNGNEQYPNTDIEVWRGSGLVPIRTHTTASQKSITATPDEKTKSSFFMSNGLTAVERLLQFIQQYHYFCKEDDKKVVKDKPSNESSGANHNINTNKSKACTEGNDSCGKSKSSTGSTSNSTPTSSPDSEQRAQYGTENSADQTQNFQSAKQNCRPEELLKIRHKCESLVRSCIENLLLIMSDYAFKELESEMNKAVCWYLTCDRYWEDGPLEPRAFPWGLILVLVMVLSLGICFCYYIIWILFDSEDTSPSTSLQKITRPRAARSLRRNISDGNNEQVLYTASGSAIVPFDHKYNSSEEYLMDSQQLQQQQHLPQYPSTSVSQNELMSSEHFIYVTYPPDLKRRLLANTHASNTSII